MLPNEQVLGDSGVEKLPGLRVGSVILTLTTATTTKRHTGQVGRAINCHWNHKALRSRTPAKGRERGGRQRGRRTATGEQKHKDLILVEF